MERPNAWLTYSDADMQDLETVAKKYRHFLNVGKTERECKALSWRKRPCRRPNAKERPGL